MDSLQGVFPRNCNYLLQGLWIRKFNFHPQIFRPSSHSSFTKPISQQKAHSVQQDFIGWNQSDRNKCTGCRIHGRLGTATEPLQAPHGALTDGKGHTPRLHRAAGGCEEGINSEGVKTSQHLRGGVGPLIVQALFWTWVMKAELCNEIPLCSPGNYVWSLMMEHDNVKKKEWVHVCVTGSPCCTVEN